LVKLNHRAVFLDRDGTICRDVPYCRDPDQIELMPGAAQAVRALNLMGFTVVLATNQSGIARGYFTSADLAKIHEKLQSELAGGSAHLDGIFYCPHHPGDNCPCRKPQPGLLIDAAIQLDIDLKASYMIGDSLVDVQAGKNAGCRSVLVHTVGLQVDGMLSDYSTVDLNDAVRWVEQDHRLKGLS
jgi:D-glycero-D-manno-heptose 1,7-bisphosphate phosphatase